MQNHTFRESTAPFNSYHIPVNLQTGCYNYYKCTHIMGPSKFWKLDRYKSILSYHNWSDLYTLTTAVCLLHANHFHIVYRKMLHHAANIRCQRTSCHAWHKTAQSIFVRIQQLLLLATIVCNECSHTTLLQIITVISTQLGRRFVPCRDMSKLTFHKCFTNTPKTAHLTYMTNFCNLN